MARRTIRFVLAALALCAACKGKGTTAATPDQRCEQLAKACGDNDKHISKLEEGCKAAAKPMCAEKQNALYDCYEKQLCGRGDRIWAFEDLGVLADRKTTCAAEKKAASECVVK